MKTRRSATTRKPTRTPLLNPRRVRRIAAACLIGGTVLQVGTCAQTLVPTLLAVAEQAVYSTLFSRLPLF